MMIRRGEISNDDYKRGNKQWWLKEGGINNDD